MFRLIARERRQTVFTALARLAQHSPKGKFRLTMLFLTLASDGRSTPSIYGPKLQNRWHDMTFRFCVSGYYGNYFSDFPKQANFEFSLLDIGANIGLYSLIAANNPRCKACYAFEPNPSVYSSLKANLVLNNVASVRAYNYAISDRDGFLDFSSRDSHSGTGRLVASSLRDSIKVRCVGKKMFDDIAASDATPKIVKIDVEGHEPVVIRELMKSKLWTDIKFLFFEANDDRYDVAQLLEEIGKSGLVKIHHAYHAGDSNLMFAQVRPNEPISTSGSTNLKSE